MDAKKLLRDSMVELMKEYPFEEITVARILEKSTLSRSTFYRNFRDKYDLLNYYYQSGVVEIFENEHFSSWEQYLQAIYSLMLGNYTYYKKAFSVDSANSFYEFLYRFSYDYIREAYVRIRGDACLDTRTRILIGYVSKGQAHLIKMWILHGAAEPVEDMARWAYELIPEECRDILDACCRKGASWATGPVIQSCRNAEQRK